VFTETIDNIDIHHINEFDLGGSLKVYFNSYEIEVKIKNILPS
jgi:hypothetical protein